MRTGQGSESWSPTATTSAAAQREQDDKDEHRHGEHLRRRGTAALPDRSPDVPTAPGGPLGPRLAVSPACWLKTGRPATDLRMCLRISTRCSVWTPVRTTPR